MRCQSLSSILGVRIIIFGILCWWKETQSNAQTNSLDVIYLSMPGWIVSTQALPHSGFLVRLLRRRKSLFHQPNDITLQVRTVFCRRFKVLITFGKFPNYTKSKDILDLSTSNSQFRPNNIPEQSLLWASGSSHLSILTDCETEKFRGRKRDSCSSFGGFLLAISAITWPIYHTMWYCLLCFILVTRALVVNRGGNFWLFES